MADSSNESLPDPCFQCRSRKTHPARRRGAQACLNCRLQKARCSGELPRCINCQRRNRECRYPSRQARHSPHKSGEPSRITYVKQVTGSELEQGLVYPVKDSSELETILDNYFLQLYPLPSYSFLHEPSIRRMCTEQTLEPSLVIAICAIVKLRCRPTGSVPYESAPMVELAEKRIWDQLERPSIFRLQALFLIIQYHAEVGRVERAFMMASIASRHVAALKLNHESPHLGFITQEIRRRAVWTMALLDGYFSVGLPGYSTINYEEIYLRFPCREETFGSPVPEGMGLSVPETPQVEPTQDSHSMLELILRISKIRRDIMRLTRQLALVEHPLRELQSILQGLRLSLSQIEGEITSAFGPSTSGSIGIQWESRWFIRVMEIRLAWHQAYCDLFRLFIPGHPNSAPDVVLRSMEPSTYVVQARVICEEHSDWIVNSISEVLEKGVQGFFSFDIARCTYQATSLSLFLAHMASARSSLVPEAVIRNAVSSLKFLQENFASSAHVQRMISDLKDLIGAYETRGSQLEAALALNSLRSSGDAVERHFQLSVHSLIHQAHFIDDSYLYER
ncbi:hypothetical protein BO70DRAFT_385502 [Aspergillus heteromorphus CBS 117.55]|uniref:Zn(2)-C6 fungal-type domain-containing protein n=1 Tax=Aspergillus heteromorphus CBS 117.55 TaxID=1448321 RepID=A0A317WVK1_9EURO|nr:uncharacterized protein BO70DRAFT_385502 [Aspergillus heteromorphus CBS 117.55]PWY88300.1 hypothetical protein BO70DRAFT_385502 [Aspergillus heteromorphus CBS 117.55]